MDLFNVLFKHRKYFLFFLCFSCVIYGLLITQQLTSNGDGIWCQTNNSGDYWERSLGRWALPPVSLLAFDSLNVDPVFSVLALTLFAAGFILVIDFFETKSGVFNLLSGLIFFSSVTICTTLSFRYTSIPYGLSFFLAVLAAYCWKKESHFFLCVLKSAICIAFSLGLYQVYLNCTCVMALFLMIDMVLQKLSWREIGSFILRAGISMLSGGVLYLILTKLNLHYYHQTLNDYKGASSVSVLNILKNLRDSVRDLYLIFRDYFQENQGLFTNRFAPDVYYAVGILFLVTLVIFLLKNRKNMAIWLPVFILIAAMPIACNAIFLITAEDGKTLYHLMTAGLSLLLLLTENVAKMTNRNVIS